MLVTVTLARGASASVVSVHPTETRQPSRFGAGPPLTLIDTAAGHHAAVPFVDVGTTVRLGTKDGASHIATLIRPAGCAAAADNDDDDDVVAAAAAAE